MKSYQMGIQNIETLKAYKFPGVGLFPRFQSMQKQSKSLQNVLALSEKKSEFKIAWFFGNAILSF